MQITNTCLQNKEIIDLSQKKKKTTKKPPTPKINYLLQNAN